MNTNQEELEKLMIYQAQSIIEFYRKNEQNKFFLVLISIIFTFLLIAGTILGVIFYEMKVQKNQKRENKVYISKVSKISEASKVSKKIKVSKENKKYDIAYNISDLEYLKKREGKKLIYKYYKKEYKDKVIFITIGVRK